MKENLQNYFPGSKDQLLSALQAAFPELIYLYNVISDKLVYVSRHLHDILGYPPEQFTDISSNVLKNFISPEDFPKIHDALVQLIKMQPGEMVRVVIRVLGASGSFHWIALRQTIYSKLPDGRVELVMGIVADITERRHEAQKLIESEQYFSSLVQSQTCYMIRRDLEDNYTYANKRFCEKFGYKQENLKTASFTSLIIPQDHCLYHEKARECIANPEAIISVTLRKNNPAGGYYWIDWEFIAIKNSEGVVNEIQCVGFDVTEKTKALQEAVQLQQKLQAIFDSTYYLLVFIGLDYKVLFCNKKGLELVYSYFGKRLQIGDDAREFIHLKSLEDFEENFKKATDNQKVVLERILPSPVGDEERLYRVEYTPVVFGGQVIGIALSSMDITETRKNEITITRSNEALRNYAHLTSHKLRSPLSNILALSLLLEDSTNKYYEASIKEVVEKIFLEAKRADDIVREMIETINRASG